MQSILFSYLISVQMFLSSFLSLYSLNHKILKWWDLYLFNSICTLLAENKHQMNIWHISIMINRREKSNINQQETQAKSRWKQKNSFFLFLFSFFFFFFFFFRTTPMAYVSSQTRGQIGATAVSLHHSHSNVGSKPCLTLCHSSWQCWILNPLSKPRDQTQVLMDTSQVCYLWATTGTAPNFFILGLCCT